MSDLTDWEDGRQGKCRWCLQMKLVTFAYVGNTSLKICRPCWAKADSNIVRVFAIEMELMVKQ